MWFLEASRVKQLKVDCHRYKIGLIEQKYFQCCFMCFTYYTNLITIASYPKHSEHRNKLLFLYTIIVV